MLAIMAAEPPILDRDHLACLAEALDKAQLTELLASAGASIQSIRVEMRAAWSGNDQAAAGRALHRLTGVAANFGCAALAAAAHRLESMLRLGHPGHDPVDGLDGLAGETLEALSDFKP